MKNRKEEILSVALQLFAEMGMKRFRNEEMQKFPYKKKEKLPGQLF